MPYDNSFKQETLELSDEIDVKKATQQLGIPYYTLADWRYIQKHQGVSYFVDSGHKCKPADEKDHRIQELESELRETKRANEIQEKANLIRQYFSADKPYTKLLTDISQIQYIDGKLYISQIIDCFNGEILSCINLLQYGTNIYV